MSKTWRISIPFSTGYFIRDYLLEHGEGYCYEIWKEFKKQLKPIEEKQKEVGYKGATYISFWKYFWMLEKLGLIRKTRTEKSLNPYIKPRVYYKLVEEKMDYPEWSNPFRALYPETWEKHH